MLKKTRLILCAGATAAAMIAGPAHAADVLSGNIAVGPTSLSQLGRLSRNNIPQDFSGSEAYPGVINSSTRYAYTAIDVPFAANALQDIYYDITFDDVSSDLFASAYENAYDPLNKAVNWLGDAGNSGNYFGTDARFFDVVVPKGSTLKLVVNSATGTGASSLANYFVTAYSDSEYNENFLSAPAVPEPASWAMMILGMGAIGFAMRRRQKVNTAIHFA